ncbi:type II toxin-antitoxin system HipA family toxin [Silvanigrella aquatica]|uniref:Phosphatidylinositol kinase n=1 Tax=Silvanigrella aquatica TaxID=1915309 RepID=A0A1L4CYM4_9BACT|nr:type II toxin-antitoxin system HipA family toxin [Silvanigrella aquatica]APJ03054.1 phosphatidylinositol kinase [Silvanigrella aquatica]
MTKSNITKYKKTEVIKVYIWDKFVGAVTLDPSLNYYVFAYDKNFGKSKIELSPIHMPLNQTEQVYVFPNLPNETYKRLPALLSDSLPDDFGNALIDRYMAEKGIPKSQITALDRLAYMGKRSMGALEFKPSFMSNQQKPTALELDKLVVEARKAVRGTIDSEGETQAALRSILDVGTSAGGARAKAVIAWNAQTQEIRSGQTQVPEGFEHWLLKFDGMGEDKELGSSQEYGRIEYAYYLMALKAGIKMSQCRLLEENNRSHFMTKRFDRENGNIKHHMQTLCAMDHLDYKKKSTNSYEQLFMVIRQLSLGHKAEVEAFRRMIFNIIGKNCDDHTKNFSFLLKENSSWELAPAYDVTFAHNPKGEWTNQHLMSVNGKYKDFSLKDILTLADRFGIGEAKNIIDEVQFAIVQWPEIAKKIQIKMSIIKHIQKLHIQLKS